jgi:hypothetical protein
MGVFSFFQTGVDTRLPEIYPIPIAQSLFVAIDVQNIFKRILIDVLERTQGVPEKKKNLLWDSCVKDQSQDGLISMIAKAMTDMNDLYLVYVPAVEVVRKATATEERQIREDYVTQARSNVGVYISFKKYSVSEMVKFYSALEYSSVGGLYKSQSLSHAIQIKVNQLRASIGNGDSERAVTDAKAIAEGLKDGASVMLDKDDLIETAKPDLTATQSTMEFIAHKQSFYLGLPKSWILGESKSGLGDSGNKDAKAIDRGLKPYFFSILKPVLDSIFAINVDFKSEDNENISVANETHKTFELTSEDYVSKENKLKILNKLYSLPENAKGDPPPKVDPLVNNAPLPGQNQAPRTGQANGQATQ